jgi:hypothetical protein
VLIEHQSGEDPVMPLRLLYFVVLYWERQWRAWEQAAAPKAPLRLSPVLPLVLHTGPGPWQNNRTLHDLLGEPAEFHGFVPQWAPLFWELSVHDADELLSSGDARQETLAVLRVQGEEAAAFERVYVEAMRRLAPLAAQDHVRWYDLMRIILSWGMWRRPGTERETLLAAARAAQVDVNHQSQPLSFISARQIWLGFIPSQIWFPVSLKPNTTASIVDSSAGYSFGVIRPVSLKSVICTSPSKGMPGSDTKMPKGA